MAAPSHMTGIVTTVRFRNQRTNMTLVRLGPLRYGRWRSLLEKTQIDPILWLHRRPTYDTSAGPDVFWFLLDM